MVLNSRIQDNSRLVVSTQGRGAASFALIALDADTNAFDANSLPRLTVDFDDYYHGDSPQSTVNILDSGQAFGLILHNVNDTRFLQNSRATHLYGMTTATADATGNERLLRSFQATYDSGHGHEGDLFQVSRIDSTGKYHGTFLDFPSRTADGWHSWSNGSS